MCRSDLCHSGFLHLLRIEDFFVEHPTMPGDFVICDGEKASRVKRPLHQGHHHVTNWTTKTFISLVDTTRQCTGRVSLTRPCVCCLKTQNKIVHCRVYTIYKSIYNVHPPCPPTMSTHHLYPPCPPTMSIQHVHPPCLPTMYTHHVHPPCPPTASTHHVHPSCPPTMSTHHVNLLCPLAW